MKKKWYSSIGKRLAFFLLLAAAFLFWGNATDAQAKVYRDGFTYQKLPSSIRQKITGLSYRRNKHIKLSDLRYVQVRHFDFNGKVKSGELIVNKKIADKIVRIFYELYKIKYPIQRMRLIDEYGADDTTSMKANNTSSFNYRVVEGTKHLSRHAMGLAIDINPRVNPYISKGRVSPANGKVYRIRNVKKCRGRYAAYMIHSRSKITKIFKKYGFSWGGDWKYSKDYQHFEIAA